MDRAISRRMSGHVIVCGWGIASGHARAGTYVRGTGNPTVVAVDRDTGPARAGPDAPSVAR